MQKQSHMYDFSMKSFKRMNWDINSSLKCRLYKSLIILIFVDIGELLTGKYAEADAENAGLPLQSQVHRDFGGRVQCEAMIHKPAAKPCMLAGKDVTR